LQNTHPVEYEASRSRTAQDLWTFQLNRKFLPIQTETMPSSNLIPLQQQSSHRIISSLQSPLTTLPCAPPQLRTEQGAQRRLRLRYLDVPKGMGTKGRIHCSNPPHN